LFLITIVSKASYWYSIFYKYLNKFLNWNFYSFVISKPYIFIERVLRDKWK